MSGKKRPPGPPDPFTTDGWRRYAEQVRKDLIPMIDDAALSMTLVPGEPDPKVGIELGLSILMEKPLVFVLDPGQYMPPKLRLIADLVIECDLTTNEGQRQLADQLEAFVATLPES